RKALGVIADAQSHPDLYGTPPQVATTDDRTDRPAGTDRTGGRDRTAGRVRVRRPSLAKTRMYLHLTLTDLLDPTVTVAEAERFGPATQTTIRDRLTGSRATIVPVLDLARDDPVDEHDPPEWTRESVVLRDRHCVFPRCTRHARACDLDPITPYIPVDQGGPPGQTAPTNSPRCADDTTAPRHRAKTARRWHYRRHGDGTYTWHGPHGSAYLVTPLGTRPLPPA
ncbi:MAG: hypothetical protein J2P22_11350, partial [Nocardioides sp.]|nr:hypothetical protein [Nocardioides sp.]